MTRLALDEFLPWARVSVRATLSDVQTLHTRLGRLSPSWIRMRAADSGTRRAERPFDRSASALHPHQRAIRIWPIWPPYVF